MIPPLKMAFPPLSPPYTKSGKIFHPHTFLRKGGGKLSTPSYFDPGKTLPVLFTFEGKDSFK